MPHIKTISYNNLSSHALMYQSEHKLAVQTNFMNLYICQIINTLSCVQYVQKTVTNI